MNPIFSPAGTFRPQDISTLIHRGVVAEHVSTAAFLWLQRDAQARSPHVALRHLARVDGRLLAHLRGIETAGEYGWDAARLALADADAGACFVIGYLAFGQANYDRMAGALRLAMADPKFEAGLLDALRWLDLARVRPHLDTLSAHEHPGIRRVILAARSFHRVAGEHELASALAMQDVSVRKAAVEAVGSLRLRGLTRQIEVLCEDPDPEIVLTSSLALAMLDRPTPLMQRFESFLAHPTLAANWRQTTEVAFRFCNPDWATSTIRRLAVDPATARVALLAIGTWGDPATMPWVLRQLDGPHARQVGEAYSLMTGADLALLDLHQDPPESSPEPEDLGDAELPWPSTAALGDHWQRIGKDYQPGHRYLAGRLAHGSSASALLRQGYQRQRRAAALALLAHDPQAILFPVHARADHQAAWLAS